MTEKPTLTPVIAQCGFAADNPDGKSASALVVQLTIFADGVPRVKPLVIFRGLGKISRKIFLF